MEIGKFGAVSINYELSPLIMVLITPSKGMIGKLAMETYTKYSLKTHFKTTCNTLQSITSRLKR